MGFYPKSNGKLQAFKQIGDVIRVRILNDYFGFYEKELEQKQYQGDQLRDEGRSSEKRMVVVWSWGVAVDGGLTYV